MAHLRRKWCSGCSSGPTKHDRLCLHQHDDGLALRCVGEWSGNKLHYLRRYADVFAKAMKKKWPNLVYLDLFSGPGQSRVRPVATYEDGSPLLALGRPYTHYFFNDLSPVVVASLEQRLRSRAQDGQVWRAWNEDANLVASKMNAEVRLLGHRTLAFAFIDPPGTHFQYASLKALTAGVQMDILVLFPLGMNIKRSVFHRLAKDPEGGKWDLYFGTPAWRDAARAPGDPGVALLDLYKNQLRKLGYQHFGIAQTIGDGNKRFYNLVFAAKDEFGKELWDKACTIEPDGQRTMKQLLIPGSAVARPSK